MTRKLLHRSAWVGRVSGTALASILGLGLTLLGAAPTLAVPVEVRGTINVPFGLDIATLVLDAGDLGDAGPPSVGGFGLSVEFDSSALAVKSVLMGSELGSPDNVRFENDGGVLRLTDAGVGEALASASLDGALAELSLLNVSLLESDRSTCVFCDGPFLDEIQDATVFLASIAFDLLDPSISDETMLLGSIALSDVVVSDAFGEALATNATIVGEPGVVVACGYAIFVLVSVWHRRRRAGDIL